MQIIQLLVSAGASVNASEDFITRKPLHFALQLQDMPPELVSYLLVQGANVNVAGWIGRAPFFHLLTRFDAATEAVGRFEHLGGKLDITDDDGNTPLHLVKDPKIANLLLGSGASSASNNKYGETPLHRASMAGRVDVISLLLDHDADIEAKDSSGRYPLLAAIATDTALDRFLGLSEQAVNYLLERGADMGAVNRAGESAAQLIGAKNYRVNETGNLELKSGHRTR